MLIWMHETNSFLQVSFLTFFPTVSLQGCKSFCGGVLIIMTHINDKNHKPEGCYLHHILFLIVGHIHHFVQLTVYFAVPHMTSKLEEPLSP